LSEAQDGQKTKFILYN